VYKIVIAVVAASLVLLGACGDDDADEEVARFCEDVETADAELGQAGDPQARADALGGIDPPADIEADWNTMVGLMVEVTRTGPDDDEAEVDPEDLEALEEMQDRIDEFNLALENVDRYVSAECEVSL
jgi:hypothetical protein